MLKVKFAKTSGFCFGVNRSIKIVEKLLDDKKYVCTLGEIIHNPVVLSSLEEKGVRVISEPSNVSSEEVLVVRSHGTFKNFLDYIKKNEICYIDATCPFVKKIHSIVSKSNSKMDVLLAAGDENHPEMMGIVSYFIKKYYVFKNLEDLENILKINPDIKNKRVIVVSQTTFSREKWVECTKFIKKALTNFKIFDTICSTTSVRQNEAKCLSQNSDAMVVLGGKHSSNTSKLYAICSENTESFLVENCHDLSNIDFSNKKCVGVISGASTPQIIMDDVAEYFRRVYNAEILM